MSDENCPFEIKIESIDNGKGYWSYNKITIFHKSENEHKGIHYEQIGEYTRNYHGFAQQTFCPFKQNGNWYALYSKSYTATRVMSLTPKCEDLGGETPESCGFCPTEYYVPLLYKADGSLPRPNRDWKWIDNPDGSRTSEWWPGLSEEEKKIKEDEHSKAFTAWLGTCDMRYADFGFVSGCHWGDDSSWKIRFVDLRKASEGKITIDERYGYWELPQGCNLRQAIEMLEEPEDTEWKNIRMQMARPIGMNVDGTVWTGYRRDILEERALKWDPEVATKARAVISAIVRKGCTLDYEEITEFADFVDLVQSKAVPSKSISEIVKEWLKPLDTK